ncbi:MAG: cryptochrome/photolyase family protein [Desulfobacteraceae bacterium]|jgi:deoxyribodipyrimidine photolyase-related protein
MSAFKKMLAARNPDPTGRRWLFVPYDQLTDGIGPLSRENPKRLGIVVIENTWKGNRRPYHKQKLALILANLRHFALEQAGRGVAVKHVVTETPYRNVLEELVKELGAMRAMRPAERELREDIKPLVDAGDLVLVPHEGWVTTREQFQSSFKKGAPWRMDAFYRRIRKDTEILMINGKPEGGKFSYWAFLKRKGPLLRGNPRMRLVLASLGKRPEAKSRKDLFVFRRVRDTLASGQWVTPKAVA